MKYDAEYDVMYDPPEKTGPDREYTGVVTYEGEKFWYEGEYHKGEYLVNELYFVEDLAHEHDLSQIAHPSLIEVCMNDIWEQRRA